MTANCDDVSNGKSDLSLVLWQEGCIGWQFLNMLLRSNKP